MPHYGTLNDFAFDKDIDDIRGTVLYGLTEKLGKIDDVIFDHSTGEIKYAVVDTGGWFTHKKFLVPADRIHAYDKDKNAFQVDLFKEHIERKFQRFDESALKSDKSWQDYEREYQRAWESDPLQHREDRVDLDVTPPEVQGNGPGFPMGSLGEEVQEPNPDFSRDRESIDAAELTPHRLAGKYPETAESSDKLHMAPARVQSEASTNLSDEFPIEANPPANPDERNPRSETADTGQWHPRMKRFEEVLKKNRVDVTASCPSCKPARAA